ncbi:MAG TPA: hypothetical protein VK789_13995, partial [Bryobacteraceae bacterium]|nr:hypothetical protein [Bryobacteraceae bacterium]
TGATGAPSTVAGPAGPTGATGPTGAAGKGLAFTANVLNPATVASFFFQPNATGDATVGGNWTSFSQAAVPMPVACIFDSLYMSSSAVPPGLGGGGVITVTLYVNSASNATALTASGNSTGPTGGSITGQSVSVNAGDLIALQASGAGIFSGSNTISVSIHCQ